MLDHATAAYVGAPCRKEHLGYVAKIEPETANVRAYVPGAGMVRQTQRVTVVWENGIFNTVGESQAAEWLADARHLDPIPEAEAAAKLQAAVAAQIARREREAAEAAEAERQREAWRDKYRAKIPADAKAVLLAVEEIDDCDIMSDYFNTKSGRVVILAFSTHTRDLFSEMRKAARNFAETAHLADAPESAEHREKWGMGAGYYLKATGRYSTGWKVEKRTFYGDHADRARHLPAGAEWAVPEIEAEPVKPATKAKAQPEAPDHETETVNGCTISAHVHDKKGFPFYIVQLPGRVDKAQFDKLLRAARESGGWYSRPWQQTPGGFAFKDQGKAHAFAGLVTQ